eukprot:gnl/TRDRNA2_/TRDRNA2_169923_c1_seq1.p1 gnl/TRDRNA2_/TRDRNA2_169923_c1~~gnl/TRDRNA2_/TRDRNA2_169923_c1_seq1.p1  ORF type:complete len:153 (+),score=4.56 gnl/TRDRNA2_/TRDRNA2_169923_c1_seq1:86-544(+)
MLPRKRSVTTSLSLATLLTPIIAVCLPWQFTSSADSPRQQVLAGRSESPFTDDEISLLQRGVSLLRLPEDTSVAPAEDMHAKAAPKPKRSPRKRRKGQSEPAGWGPANSSTAAASSSAPGDERPSAHTIPKIVFFHGACGSIHFFQPQQKSC